jgi:hypothetical protein
MQHIKILLIREMQIKLNPQKILRPLHHILKLLFTFPLQPPPNLPHNATQLLDRLLPLCIRQKLILKEIGKISHKVRNAHHPHNQKHYHQSPLVKQQRSHFAVADGEAGVHQKVDGFGVAQECGGQGVNAVHVAPAEGVV